MRQAHCAVAREQELVSTSCAVVPHSVH